MGGKERRGGEAWRKCEGEERGREMFSSVRRIREEERERKWYLVEER